MGAGGMLAGDMLSALAGAALDRHRERSGPTDPESMVDLMAYPIPFRTEPAVGVVLPPEAWHAD